MPKDKEWSAVSALLEEINRLRERVDVLEKLLWVWTINTARRWSYTSLNDYPSIGQSIRDVVSYRWNYEDDTIYAVYQDGTRVPMFTNTNTNTDVGPRTVAYCTSSHS